MIQTDNVFAKLVIGLKLRYFFITQSNVHTFWIVHVSGCFGRWRTILFEKNRTKFTRCLFLVFLAVLGVAY